VEILAASAGAAASKSDLDAWVNTYAIPVTSVRDPDSMPLASLTALARREIAYIVDLKTMKIVQRIDGSVLGVQPNAVRQAIQQILVLLGAKNG
jgi:hypothetical protein